MSKRLALISFFINSIIFSQKWVTQLNDEYSPAVVIVVNQQNGELLSYGSGFNISKDGLIVTNYHVVKEADKIIVKFKNGDVFEGQHYSYVDEEKDFVIIKIPGFDLPTVKFGNSNKVEIGNEVIAIGNPKGAWHTVTKGIISQKVDYGRYKMFQTDVFIAPGSSGGPLFNNKKEIIGVTTSGIEVGLDINYVIPINYVIGAKNSSNNKSTKSIGFDIKKVTYRQPSNNTNKSTNSDAQKIESVSPSSSSNTSLSPAEDSFYGCVGLYCCYLLILGLIPAE